MKTKLIKNSLINLKPGEYICSAEGANALLKIQTSTQGLIVDIVGDSHRCDKLLTVLVNGKLINVWSEKV